MIKDGGRKAGTVRGKTRFVVIREFAGRQTMAEAFGRLLQQKAFERYEQALAGKQG